MLFDIGRYRDTGTVDDMRRSDRQKATTVVDDRYLRISARRSPESNATMLFVQPQDVVIELKLYEIGCMMRNFTPNVYGEVHI